MAIESHYDVIIIGTGAGGATLSHRLAPSGLKILILERGDYVPREKINWSSLEVNLKGHYLTKEKWRTRDGEVFEPHTNYNVGGNTKFFGAALFRLREADFGEIRHHGGISPAWPLSYQRPCAVLYARLRNSFRFTENVEKIRRSRRQTGPYPFPAISHEERLENLSTDFKAAGLHPFHTPLGVRLDEQHRRTSPCIRCNTCDGFPCLIHAKSDAEVLCIEPTLRKYDNVTLLTNAKVTKLETETGGKEVSGVLFEQYGRGRRSPGTSLWCPAARSTRQRCCCGPRAAIIRTGLANRSDVGRAALYGPYELRRHGAIAVPQSDRLSEDAFGQRLSTPHRVRGSFPWATFHSSANWTWTLCALARLLSLRDGAWS